MFHNINFRDLENFLQKKRKIRLSNSRAGGCTNFKISWCVDLMDVPCDIITAAMLCFNTLGQGSIIAGIKLIVFEIKQFLGNQS